MKAHHYLIALIALIIIAWRLLEHRKKSMQQKENKFRSLLIRTTEFILKASRYSTQDADKAGKMVEDLTDLTYNKWSQQEAAGQLYCWKAKFGELYK